MDKSTTTWVIVALLLLLIAVAIFLLLRRPGGDSVDTRDADALADRDARATDPAALDRDRDGVADRADVAPYDQEADQGRAREAAAIGATGAAAAGIDDVAREDVVRDGSTDDETTYEETAYAGTHQGGATAAEPSADQTAYAVTEDDGSGSYAGTTTGTSSAPPADSYVADEDEQGRWREAASIGALGAAGAGTAAAASDDARYAEQSADTDVRPLSSDEVDAGASAQPLSVDEQAPAEDQGYATDDTYVTDTTQAEQGYATDDTYAETADADRAGWGGDAADAAGVGATAVTADRDDEYAVGQDTTYRAGDGEAVVVDDTPTDGRELRPGDEGYLGAPASEGYTAAPAAPQAYAPEAASQGYTSEPASQGYTSQPADADYAQSPQTDQGYTSEGQGYSTDGGSVDQGYGLQDGSAPVDQPVAASGYDDTTAADSQAGSGAAGGAVFAESIYGAGSAEPLEDGSGPAGWNVKGNAGSMLFHTEDSPSYDAVRAEVWFESEEAARAAGFAHWDRRRR